MIQLSIVMDSKTADAFIVQLSGAIKRPKAFNEALGKRLERELQGHFLTRNKQPNAMAAPKTDFWSKVRDSTVMTEATDSGATVTIEDKRFRIHLFGGVIKPTGGRKFLTIPLVKDARGLRVSDYEEKSGNKLFRLPGTRVLVERDKAGDRSLVSPTTATIRRKDGSYRQGTVRAQSRLRVVYALAGQVKVPRDPRALPPTAKLVEALLDTGNRFLAKYENKGGVA